MRPLFYSDNREHMKYLLSPSNFKVYHEIYLNPLHPDFNGGGPNIFDYAMIVDRTTNRILKENEKLTPVATAEVGNGHAVHAMVLDCILADIKRDPNGQPILNSNGRPEMENFSFKFKNTDRNDKQVIIDAGK